MQKADRLANGINSATQINATKAPLQLQQMPSALQFVQHQPQTNNVVSEHNNGSVSHQLMALKQTDAVVDKPFQLKEQPTIQQKENRIGLPNNLKEGMENLSGFTLDDVKVLYNSPKPAQLQAYAYAQGDNIQLAPGQEKHLPHEAWHVVQQKQGRVQPTLQARGNDDKALENKANDIGMKALQLQAATTLSANTNFPFTPPGQNKNVPETANAPIQRAVFKEGTEKYDKTTKTLGKNNIAKGSTSVNITKTSDENLPTAYGILKGYFGNNLIDVAFKAQINALVRPRSVTAIITKDTVYDRFDLITTAIGNLGDDEFKIKTGKKVSLYDGGHLIGANILGLEAAEAYDIAPQERVSNQKFYNHTIENALRNSKNGTKYSYEVSVNYLTNNYRTDQQNLLNNGIIKAIDPSVPWEIWIPSRIPNEWNANAQIIGGGNFKNMEADTVKLSQPSEAAVKSTDRDFSVNNIAAFHVAATPPKTATNIAFFMNQYVPPDMAHNAKPPLHAKNTNLINPADYEEKKLTSIEMEQFIQKNIPVALTFFKAEINKLEKDKDAEMMDYTFDLPEFKVDETIPAAIAKSVEDKEASMFKLVDTSKNKTAPTNFRSKLQALTPKRIWLTARKAKREWFQEKVSRNRDKALDVRRGLKISHVEMKNHRSNIKKIKGINLKKAHYNNVAEHYNLVRNTLGRMRILQQEDFIGNLKYLRRTKKKMIRLGKADHESEIRKNFESEYRTHAVKTVSNITMHNNIRKQIRNEIGLFEAP